jgi:hypothetical protein
VDRAYLLRGHVKLREPAAMARGGIAYVVFIGQEGKQGFQRFEHFASYLLPYMDPAGELVQACRSCGRATSAA